MLFDIISTARRLRTSERQVDTHYKLLRLLEVKIVEKRKNTFALKRDNYLGYVNKVDLVIEAKQ